MKSQFQKIGKFTNLRLSKKFFLLAQQYFRDSLQCFNQKTLSLMLK